MKNENDFKTNKSYKAFLSKQSVKGRIMIRSKNKCAFKSLGILLFALVVVGCQQGDLLDPNPLSHIPVHLEERHPIHVYKQGVEIQLTIREDARRLTTQQRTKVSRFLHAYKRRGRGTIEIAAPTGSNNELATFNVLKHIREILKKHRISSKSIDFVPYHAKSEKQPAIYMTYGKYYARGPDCNHWPDNLAENQDNVVYQNFGCAHQRNLAAMIANPRDLIKPYDHTPRSSERRDVIWDKYVKGETTAADKSDDEKGTVSDVAQ